jgi:hypothetical protein
MLNFAKHVNGEVENCSQVTLVTTPVTLVTLLSGRLQRRLYVCCSPQQ